jgi:hypothetical protein
MNASASRNNFPRLLCFFFDEQERLRKQRRKRDNMPARPHFAPPPVAETMKNLKALQQADNNMQRVHGRIYNAHRNAAPPTKKVKSDKPPEGTEVQRFKAFASLQKWRTGRETIDDLRRAHLVPAPLAPEAAQGDEVIDVCRPFYNAYRQELDHETRAPVIASHLQWPEVIMNLPQGKTGKRQYAEKHFGRVLDAEDQKPRMIRQDTEEVTPRHVPAMMNTLSLACPRFTARSKLAHSQIFWDNTTQCPNEASGAPCRGVRARAQSAQPRGRAPATFQQGQPASARKNPIRNLVALRAQSASRAWR